MEYISAAEAAERWGVSLRQVQRLLADGRILRAKKYGRSWMIPCDAEKPLDPRQEKKPPQSSLSSDLSHLIAATCVPLPAPNPDAILERAGDERARRQYQAELAYMRGDFAQTLRCFFKTEEDDAARLQACIVATGAAISIGDYPAYKQIEAFLKGCVKIHPASDVSAFAELALATAAVSVIAPNMAPKWLQEGDLSALAPPVRPFALYLRAKYFQCTRQYEAMLAVSQTALSLSEPEHGISQTGLYLRLCCAMACHALGQRDRARRYLLEAMGIAMPYGFITPFAETVTALGGLMEECLEREYPACTDAVLGQWKRTFGNWITFHNQFTKDNITLILSLREYHIAQSIARHIPYKKVAEQHCVSLGRLGNIMQDIYQKLSVSGREELAKYVL
jgi:DNA-binding CsgD family transcriptional regulator